MLIVPKYHRTSYSIGIGEERVPNRSLQCLQKYLCGNGTLMTCNTTSLPILFPW